MHACTCAMILVFHQIPGNFTTRTRRRPFRFHPSRPSGVLLLVLLLIVCLAPRTEAQSIGGNTGYEDTDEYAEFVQRVVEEHQDQHHDGNDYATRTDQEYERQQEELLRRQRAEEERIQRQQEERNRRIQEEREAAFEAELAQLSDEKEKAAARKQKKRDAAIVQRILREAAKGNHYAVLGLHYRKMLSFNLHIPARTLTLLPGGTYRLHTPEINLLRSAVTPVQIKRAYRERARAVHPDKCRDGRAVEAFHAVEHAASILLDATARAAYDAQLAERRRAQRQRVRQYLRVGWEQLGRIGRRVQSAFQLLGPFALPLTILAVWIF